MVSTHTTLVTAQAAAREAVRGTPRRAVSAVLVVHVRSGPTAARGHGLARADVAARQGCLRVLVAVPARKGRVRVGRGPG